MYSFETLPECGKDFNHITQNATISIIIYKEIHLKGSGLLMNLKLYLMA